jgi:hypothetical protein
MRPEAGTMRPEAGTMRREAGTMRRRLWDLSTATMVILATYHRPFFGLLDPIGRKKAGPS